MSKRSDAKLANLRGAALTGAERVAWGLDDLPWDINEAIKTLAEHDPSTFTGADEVIRRRAITAIDAAVAALPAIGRMLPALRDTLDPQHTIARAVAATCDWCSGAFPRTRADASYCSSRCRQAAYRHRLRVAANPQQV